MALPLAIFAAGAALDLGGSIYAAKKAQKDLKRQHLFRKCLKLGILKMISKKKNLVMS